MSKDNNLKDFLTDIADAIRKKKETTDLINPQDFSSEIKSLSKSIWTGHVDVEGLKAIGWDDEDIAYFQEHGVNWNEEDDEYYKVSDDNKALYGVLTADNIQEYKDRIVWLPKIDVYGKKCSYLFQGCIYMKGIPFLDISKSADIRFMFDNCCSLSTIPYLDFSNTTFTNTTFKTCHSLMYVPPIISANNGNITNVFNGCSSLKSAEFYLKESAWQSGYSFQGCRNLVSLKINIKMQTSQTLFYECVNMVQFPDVRANKASVNTFYKCYNLRKIKIFELCTNQDLSYSPFIEKESVLFALENETATESITVTLHASAYARLAEDPDIVEALANHPLVTLASA